MTALRLWLVLGSVILICGGLTAGFYYFGPPARQDLILDEAVKALLGFLLGGLLAAVAALLIRLHFDERTRQAGRAQFLKDAVGRCVDAANTLRRLAATQDPEGPEATRILRIQRVAETQSDISRLRHDIGDNFRRTNNTLVENWEDLNDHLKAMEEALGRVERELRKAPRSKDAETPDLLPGLLDADASPAEIQIAFFERYNEALKMLRRALVSVEKLR